jgi:predicted enzyme related to lactoylglutathione lyase
MLMTCLRGDAMEGVKWGIIVLGVSDMDKMVKFYTKTLGFKLVTQDKDWSEIDTPGVYIGMHLKEKGDKTRGSGNSSISYGVKSIKDTMASLKKKGVKLGKIEEEYEGYMLMTTFKDPEGNEISLVEKRPGFR